MLQLSVFGRQRQVFYGWVMVAASFVNQLLNSGLGFLGFGTYVVPLQQEFGWSKAAIAAARSLMQMENGLLGPIQGVLIDRFGPRLVMAVGSFFFGLGLILLSLVHSLLVFYGVFLVIALGTSLAGFLTTTVAVNSWFQRRRTTAMALAGLGVSFGGIVVLPLLIAAQTSHGWRFAALASGLAAWALGLPTSLLMRQSPEKYGALPDGDVAESFEPSIAPVQGRRESRVASDFTLGEALRTRAFWFISGGHSLGLVVVSAVTVHQFAHMEEGVGLGAGAIATVITLLSSSNILGRLIGGITGDRFDKRYLAAAGLVGAAASLVILATAASFWQAVLYGVCYGFFWGLRGPMADSLRGDYFGRASFGKISGVASLINMFGSICGPIFAGFMADVQGNYTMGFVILAIVSGLGSVLFFLGRRPPRPKRLIVLG